MNNKQVTGLLHHLADLLELSGENAFRVGAYRRAARAIENSRQNIVELQGDFSSIAGVGKGMAQIIEEMLTTGTSQLLEEKKAALPPGLIELLQLPGVGPKTIYTLYQSLGVTDIQLLQQAAEQEQIRSLKGFGPKKEQKILEAIRTFRDRPKRYLWSTALLVGHRLLERLRSSVNVERAELAGSLRRKQETVKDIDLIVATDKPEQLATEIEAFPEVGRILQQGSTKINLEATVDDHTLSVDIRLVTSAQFASTLHHFTGSSAHNIRIRRRAKELGYRVNEYGITESETGEILTFADEGSFFNQLQLPYIVPELREDRGEIEAALEGELPQLIEQQQYQGDLHTHSLYSDGAHSIAQMVEAAQARGYNYLAITDHSRSLRVASGLAIDDLYEQWAEIDRLNEQLTDFIILKGSEVDILADGSLDYPDSILEQMDIVIASIHTSMRQDQATMTKRIIAAMRNPHVHMIGHPTGRVLLRREPYEVEIDQLFQVAQETGTILELNANPLRLDLNDLLLKKAKEEYQLKFSINTDAHAISQLDLISYGIGTARRGWLEQNDVLNLRPWEEAKQWLKSP